ncbi:Maltose O-acetyltransferase [Posidoniimonas corsicana]|uniref:Maltose O-acetyltransferase n=1 Tax=Posidoniimonas corsicana TaxID=1938618 RepID=A0A5C5VBH2_9BACT|nr:putative colanic acid biosynthesis acetyltransferase [Posidoniimonas corsicana]TWT35964.1 Maltose O-acetyltransferase [Posidoniimonas corsicana]
MPPELDIAENRRAVKYSRGELLLRVVWGLAKPLFRYSPRPCFAWRRWLLRRLGARVGRDVHVYPTAIVYYPWMLSVGDGAAIGEDALVYNLGPVSIGDRATISHRAHLCAGTHDHRDPALPLLRPPITIGPQAWVCAEAFIGPGVTVGEGAVVGARAAAFKDVPDWAIVGGNPASYLGDRVLGESSSGGSCDEAS